MKLERVHGYLNPEGAAPETYSGWPLFGMGVERLGVNGKPVELRMPEVKADQLLMRIDAVSLCYTDLKEIDQGETHPRLTGRDLSVDPIVPGHEVSMTVISVGDDLKGQYRTGQRFTIQPDVWVDGKSVPFCFGMDGGYRQYAVIGREILNGDAGNYLIPVPENMSYAASAITEPWACVEAAYRMAYRDSVKDGGAVLILGGASARRGYRLDQLLAPGCTPGEVVVSGLPQDLMERLAHVCEVLAVPMMAIEREALFGAERAFDDVILLDCSVEDVSRIDAFLKKGTVVALLSDGSLAGEIQIDLGKLHYDDIQYVGSTSLNIADAYRQTPARVDFKPEGVTWIFGAGGPMGRMHLQRAIESPHGPRSILATEISADRYLALEPFFAPLAREHHKELIIVNPREEPERYQQVMDAVLAQGGVDDIEIMVAHPSVMAEVTPYVGQDGVVNLFAGLKRGVKAGVDPCLIYGSRQVRFIGHSGSALDDQKAVIERTRSGQLKPELSVAAIGGLNQIADGIRAMKNWVYPGKIIIYPHVTDFALTAVTDMGQVFPEMEDAVGSDGIWTQEAEKLFLERGLSE